MSFDYLFKTELLRFPVLPFERERERAREREKERERLWHIDVDVYMQLRTKIRPYDTRGMHLAMSIISSVHHTDTLIFRNFSDLNVNILWNRLLHGCFPEHINLGLFTSRVNRLSILIILTSYHLIFHSYHTPNLSWLPSTLSISRAL